MCRRNSSVRRARSNSGSLSWIWLKFFPLFLFLLTITKEVMVEVFGGRIDVCGEIKHGKTSTILHDMCGVFAGVTQGVNVVRYHSLGCKADDLAANAPSLIVTCRTEESQIVMGVRHRTAAIEVRWQVCFSFFLTPSRVFCSIPSRSRRILEPKCLKTFCLG